MLHNDISHLHCIVHFPFIVLFKYFRTFEDKEEAERGFKVISGYTSPEQGATNDDTTKEQSENESGGKRKREDATPNEDDDIIVL